MLFFAICLLLNSKSYAVELNLDKEKQTVVRGLIRAVNQSTLSAEIDAQILQMPEAVGSEFKKDDVLVKFNCVRQYQEAKAAKAWSDIQQQKVNSNKVLQQHESIGAFEILTSVSELSKAKAELNAIRARNQGCVIRAPFDGYVIDKKVNKFEAVAMNQPLIEIVDLRRMNVEVIIPSSWLNWLQVGDSFEFFIDETSEVIFAEVVFIRPYIDAVSKTVKVIGAVSQLDIEEKMLLPGMSGSVKFMYQEGIE